MDLDQALRISAAGMQAQSTRLRVVAENLANRDSTGQSPGADPYRRKTVTFANRLDRQAGMETVRVSRVGTAPGEFRQDYDPGHPAADARGYVMRPNVDSLVEMMDMREAQRSYSANLSVLETTRGMLTRTIEALR
ncbi:flagellar basal-body rod protein FlgC [Siccirubricoccus deserti]|uniref:Flagellar basal-body rod protein FlgC n=1 Tax=Siccirubricoccus deserti TaxID=2013562 RepID=A0A9X0UJA3_9PROT|nr:flagellar basal body rod protein FlgC [Siccirubricoccus deserti]MBC4017905.1 flagellar basal body rod protein FlgC [Siccirubricoccus deserti]GGC61633.1 flagellar basal-body rod protein FlgC [Siccirubricoccus deserti]